MSTQSEGYPPDWARVTLMVSPDGQMHAIDGDREGDDPDADNPFVGLERIRTRMDDQIPEMMRDRYGWPIETYRGRPWKSLARVIALNLRKIGHRRHNTPVRDGASRSL